MVGKPRQTGVDARCAEQAEFEDVDRLRLHTRTGLLLGGVLFLNLLEACLKRPVRPHPQGRKRKQMLKIQKKVKRDLLKNPNVLIPPSFSHGI